MRFEASVTSISWIPSESMTGPLRVPVDMGIGHYDDPLPDHVDDLGHLRRQDRFRFANHLEAWIEVEGDRIVDFGYSGRGHMGATTISLGLAHITIPAVAFPDLQQEPVVTESSVTFAQTTGGRTGAPLPHRIDHPPFVKISAPTVWTTLSLTLHRDGSHSFELTGASKMPRHWVYDTNGDLAAKSGMIDFKGWTHEDFGNQTPWGDTDSPVIVTAVESALERVLSVRIMSEGAKPSFRKLAEGEELVHQGDAGDDLFLLLDGILVVEVDGEEVAEVGPGAVLGERSILEGGRRTASLRAATPARVAVAPVDKIDREALEELAKRHR